MSISVKKLIERLSTIADQDQPVSLIEVTHDGILKSFELRSTYHHIWRFMADDVNKYEKYFIPLKKPCPGCGEIEVHENSACVRPSELGE